MTNNTSIKCTNCGTPNPTTQQQGNYIDDGIAIDVNTLGHYGGFIDDFPPKENSLAHLCHDCCVILLNVLPGFAAFAQMSGGHSNLNSRYPFNIDNGTLIVPCCQYAWTWDKTDKDNIVTYLAAPQLTWVKHPQEQN